MYEGYDWFSREKWGSAINASMLNRWLGKGFFLSVKMGIAFDYSNECDICS